MAKNKCPQCGLVNWVDAEVCKRCKSSLLQTNETHDGAAEVRTPRVRERRSGLSE